MGLQGIGRVSDSVARRKAVSARKMSSAFSVARHQQISSRDPLNRKGKFRAKRNPSIDGRLQAATPRIEPAALE